MSTEIKPAAEAAHPSHPQTKAHIRRVQTLLSGVIEDLQQRQQAHDASKLVTPEVEHFDRVCHVRGSYAYHSEEYKQVLASIKPALDHHYQVNDHHPQHFSRGIHGMGLVQLIEMVVDWKASGEQDAGCIFRSIEIDSKRFGYGDELKNILFNTARYLGWAPEPTEPDEVYINGEPTTEYYCLYNSLRFTIGPARGSVVRAVFKRYDIDHTFEPAPGVFSCLVYNHILPEGVRLDYDNDKPLPPSISG